MEKKSELYRARLIELGLIGNEAENYEQPAESFGPNGRRVIVGA